MRASTLHAHVAHADTERKAAGVELVDEVVVRGAGGARHEPDAQRHLRQLVDGVGAQQAFGLELAEDAVAVGGERAGGEHRVDAGHDQLQSPGRGVHVHVALHAHLDVVGELDAGHLAQRGVDGHEVAAEQRHIERGLDSVAALVLLDELEVHVPGPGLAQPLHLAPHPHVLRDRLAQRVPDGRVQLGDGESRLVHTGTVPAPSDLRRTFFGSGSQVSR
jgi:hypothetical protein